MSDTQHQQVQIGLAELLVDTVNRQMPRLGGQRQSRHHQPRDLSLIQPHVGKEPLQPPMHRGDLRSAVNVKGQPCQIDGSGC